MALASTLARRATNRLAIRSLSTETGRHFNPIPVDIDHFTSGWTIEDIKDFTQKGKYAVQTFNQISTKGLARFPPELYDVSPREYASGPANALLLRSHKLQESEVDVAVRAIARCGAGTNK